MRKTIITAVLAVLVGALLGTIFGLTSLIGHRWDVSMENADYWKQEAAKIEKTQQDAAEGKIKAPKVEIPEIEYDFGVLEKNEKNIKGSHDFLVKNVGTAPLTLKENGKSCFCTEFTIGKKTLLPGESTTVNVQWDAERGGGNFKQSVLIASNAPNAPEFFFNVKGLFSSPVVCNPNQLRFSGISNTEENSREFHILGFGSDAEGNPLPLEITEPTVSDPDHFEISLQPGSLDEMTDAERSNPVLGKATSLINATMTVKPGLSQGAFQEVIRFKTNRPDLPYLELMVEGQVAGSVTISGAKYDKHKTGQLMIGPVSSATGATEKIRLTIFDKNLIADESTLSVAKTRPEWMKVQINYPDAETQKKMPVKLIDVDVEIPAGSPQERYSGPGLGETGEIVFQIGSDEGDRQEVILPVSFAVGP